MTEKYFETDSGIALLAHRGLAIPGTGVLENTLTAFQAAINAGATHLETDVQSTRDGVPVLFHDGNLQRVFNDSRRVDQLSFSEMAELANRNQAELLSLSEALSVFPSAKFNLDVKSWSAVSSTIEAIERAAAHDRVLVSSFSDTRRLMVLRGLSRPVSTSGGSQTVIRARLASAVNSRTLLRTSLIGVHALQVPVAMYGVRFASDVFISKLRAIGLQVHFWTINDLETAESLLKMGATGLVSDRVDLLAPLLGKH